MAPQTAQPEDLVTQQHTADAKVNQVFFIFAFGIGGLVVLSATAYACYYVVGRLRKSRVPAPATIEDATQVEVLRSAPRALKLPGMVQEGAKAPKRLILSPNYPLPVYTNFEWVEDVQEPRRKSWFRAGHRGRGLSLQGPVHVATRSMHQVQFPSAGIPENVAIREVGEESYHTVSLEKHLADFTTDEASILAEAATSHGPSSTATDPSSSLSAVMATSTPKVAPHKGSSPSIFIDEFNLPPPYECSVGADHSFLDFDEEKVPSQYLEVPTLACEAPEKAEAGGVLTPAKALKKKRSLSKLVSALGDLSNIGHRRSKSDISSKAHKFRKLEETSSKKERPLACSTPRAKENMCHAL